MARNLKKLVISAKHIPKLGHKKTKTERFSRFRNDKQAMDQADEIDECKKKCQIPMHTK
jgi:hypothetical protein